MSDDEGWHVYPSGLVIRGSNGPRIVDGVDTLTGEPAGGQPPTPKEVEEADARSVEHRRQRAQSIFTDPVWPADRVVSWIGYRDVQAIEESFAPIHHKDSRPVVEGAPRIALLRALQEGRLAATQRRGGKVHIMIPNEWFPVERAWPVHLWPECFFASADVCALWPAITRNIESGTRVVDKKSFNTFSSSGGQRRELELNIDQQQLVAKKRGRKKGSGSYREFDLQLAREAVDRVAKGEAQKAVLEDIASRARGSGAPASKAKRIEHLLAEVRRVNQS